MSKSHRAAIVLEVLVDERMSYDGYSVEATDSPEPLTRSEVKQLRKLLRWNMALQRRGYNLSYHTPGQIETLTQIAESLIEQAEQDAKKSPVQRLKEMLDRTAAEAAEGMPAEVFTAKDVQFLRWFRRAFLGLQRVGRKFVTPNAEERDALTELIEERIEAKRKAAGAAEAISERVEAKRKAEADQADHDTRTETKGRKFYLSDEIHNRLWQYSRQQQETASEIVSGILDRNLPRYKVTTESETADSTPPTAEAVCDLSEKHTYIIAERYETGYECLTVRTFDEIRDPAAVVAEFIDSQPAIVAASLKRVDLYKAETFKHVHAYSAEADHATAAEDQASS